VPLSGQDDRAFASRIDQRDRAALWFAAMCDVQGHAPRAKLVGRAMSELVIAECGEEVRLGAPARELNRRDATSSRGHRHGRGALDDLAGARDVIDAQELDPFDVADDCDAHALRIR